MIHFDTPQGGPVPNNNGKTFLTLPPNAQGSSKGILTPSQAVLMAVVPNH